MACDNGILVRCFCEEFLEGGREMKYLLFGIGVVTGVVICVLYVVGYAVEQEKGW